MTERNGQPNTIAVRAAEAPVSAYSSSPDALRQARSYLDSARRRLGRGGPGQADEVLALLRLATAQIEVALEAHHHRGAE